MTAFIKEECCRMNNAVDKLANLNKEKEFLVGIDSDGCVFDTMEVKHKECFIPNIINEWDLQAVSKYAREAAEFVNLYSVSRGINRFPALIEVMELLADRKEVQKRGFTVPDVEPIRQWMKTETKLGNPALAEAVERTGDPVLKRALKWSIAVNDAVERIVRGVPPFPYVRESLEKISEHADIIVVSATPGEALHREWEEHGIAKYAKVICGQEMGTKKEHLSLASKGRYEAAHVLMIGDAPGDLKAAKANGALFYPINPGDEDMSWQRFYEEAFDRFISGTYAGVYEESLINEFNRYLPSKPPWKQ
jgi:phosphoglycolate phosphatase-like HAD superfamily hydrolase